MLTRFAKMLSSFFISKALIQEEEREVYDYCFEIMLSTVLNLMVVLFISIITHTIIPTIFYIVSFMIVRKTAGGYHAESHLACLAILVLSYVSFLVLLHILPHTWLKIASIVFVFISGVLVFFLSPIEDHNKPLTEEETKKFKKKSRITILLLSLLTVALIALLSNEQIPFSLASGMFTVSISLIAGKIKNYKINFSRA